MKNKTKNKTVVGRIQTGIIFMKKYLIIVALAGVSAFFTACEKDEPKNPVENPVDNKKTVNLKVSLSNGLPGATPEQAYIRTLTKDTLNKVFADASVGKVEIEFIGANDFTNVSTTSFTRAIDSLYLLKSVFGDKIVVKTKELAMTGNISSETLAKMETLGLTIVLPKVAKVKTSFKQRYGQTVAQLMERSKVRGA